MDCLELLCSYFELTMPAIQSSPESLFRPYAYEITEQKLHTWAERVTLQLYTPTQMQTAHFVPVA